MGGVRVDAGQLIAARAAMGVGSALIMPAAMAVLMWTFSGAARATAIGRCRNCSRPAAGRGPSRLFLVGLGLSDQHPYRGAGVGRDLHADPEFPQSHPASAGRSRGLLLSISGLASLAYGLIRAGQVASWSPTDVWAPIIAGLILLVAFVLVELRTRQPSFDPRLLAQRMFGGR
jgi:hypothetical protein